MGFSKAEMVHRGPAPNRSEKLERRCGLGKLLEQTHRRTDAQTHTEGQSLSLHFFPLLVVFPVCSSLFCSFTLCLPFFLPSCFFFFPKCFPLHLFFLFYLLLFIPPNTEISTQEEITWQPQVTHFLKAS